MDSIEKHICCPPWELPTVRKQRQVHTASSRQQYPSRNIQGCNYMRSWSEAENGNGWKESLLKKMEQLV
jgi:hypothetical protein